MTARPLPPPRPAVADVARLLRPGSVAVVGASPRTFVGGIALRNLRALGFAGTVTPVNPRRPEIDGVPAAGSMAELDHTPDVALLLVGADRVLHAAREAVDCGVRGLVVPGAGHTDSGAAADTVIRGLRALAADTGVVVAGPNCMGYVDMVTGAAPYVGTVPAQVRAGRIGVVAQSGAVVEAVINAGGRVPLSTAVSSGTEAVTDLADYLRFFAADEHTHAVLAFVEAVADPTAFLAAAEALAAAGKPLAICKVGRSAVAQAGVTAHSGKLAGSHRVAMAAMRQAGAIVCDDLDELLVTGELLAVGRPPGERLHIVANSGGEANLLADLTDDTGLRLPPLRSEAVAALRARWPRFTPGNPLDPWGVDDYRAVYPEALRIAAAEPGDVLVVSLDAQTTCGDAEQRLALDLAGWLADAAHAAAAAAPPAPGGCGSGQRGPQAHPDGPAAEATAKLCVFLSPASHDPPPALARLCAERGIALLRGARPALTAIARTARWAPVSPAPPADVTATAAPAPSPAIDLCPILHSALDEDAALNVVAAYGIDVPRRERVADAGAAVVAAERIGFPVVVKCLIPGVTHKTELGLVATGLVDAQAVRAAALHLLARAQDRGMGAELLVAEHVPADLELVAGYRRDPQFGPTVVVGLGGVWAEHLDDVAVRVGRVTAAEAEALLDETVAGRLLRHPRGAALPLGVVAHAVAALSALGCDHPRIAAAECNPLRVSRDRVVAVDALVEMESES